MTVAATNDKKPIPQRRIQEAPSLAAQLVTFVNYLLGLLIMSWFFSLISEWIGLAFIWSDQGVRHSEVMLQKELNYLERDFNKVLFFARSPAQIATDFNHSAYHTLVVSSGFQAWRQQWLAGNNHTDASFVRLVRAVYQKIDRYVVASINITQVYLTRLLVIVLSFPVYLLFGFCALIDGLVQRDLRRYGVGHEHGRVYHIAKQYHTPIVVLTAFTYLALPFSLHPNWVFLPAAALFGLSIYITATTYQKYL